MSGRKSSLPIPRHVMEIDDRVLEIGTRVKYVAKDEFERKAATIVNVDTSGMANGEPPEYTIRLDIGGTERSTFREYLTIDTKMKMII